MGFLRRSRRVDRACLWLVAVQLVALPAAAQEVAQRFDIGAIDVTGNTLLPQIAIERAVYPHVGPGRSVEDVEAARADLEKAYHALGYDSVVVAIPQQSASAGIIRLEVTEARIGAVKVTGVSGGAARRVIAGLPALGEGAVPNLTKAQGEITELNRLPNRQVTPLLKPGQQPGTLDVELKVDQKSPYHATVQLSNDHSPNTRPLRLLASLRDDNLWGLGHTISGTYVVAPQDRSNAEVFAGSYLAPIWGSSWSLLVYGYKSNSNVATLGGTNVLGDGYAIGARAILQLPSSAGFSHSLNFGIDYKDFNEDLVFGTSDPIRTPIYYWPLVGSYQATLAGNKDVLNATLSVTANVRPASIGRTLVPGVTDPVLVDAFGNKRGANDAQANFVHWNLDLDYTRTLPADFVGVVRFSGQLADGPLISNEQFAAGGLTSVRGFLQSEAIGDNGVSGTAELRTPSLNFAGFVDELRLIAFTDVGYAHVLQASPEVDDSFTLWSAGVGTRFQFFKYLSGDLAVAWPLVKGSRERKPYAVFSVKAEY